MDGLLFVRIWYVPTILVVRRTRTRRHSPPSRWRISRVTMMKRRRVDPPGSQEVSPSLGRQYVYSPSHCPRRSERSTALHMLPAHSSRASEQTADVKQRDMLMNYVGGLPKDALPRTGDVLDEGWHSLFSHRGHLLNSSMGHVNH